MQLEELVPSFELCERLKELGYPQSNGFSYWTKKYGEWSVVVVDRKLGNWTYGSDAISAPTASELSCFLPAKLKRAKINFYKIGSIWIGSCLDWIESGELVEVMAKMLIWLAENGHVKFEEG